MKKLLLILLPLLFLGCKRSFEYTVYNRSDIDVDFILEEYNLKFHLNSNESVNINFTDNENIILLNHPRCYVNKCWDAYFCDLEILNMKYKIVNVFNTSNLDISLYEVNGLIGENYNDIITIPSNNSIAFKVWTNKPQYRAIFTENNIKANIELLSFY